MLHEQLDIWRQIIVPKLAPEKFQLVPRKKIIPASLGARLGVFEFTSVKSGLAMTKGNIAVKKPALCERAVRHRSKVQRDIFPAWAKFAIVERAAFGLFELDQAGGRETAALENETIPSGVCECVAYPFKVRILDKEVGGSL